MVVKFAATRLTTLPNDQLGAGLSNSMVWLPALQPFETFTGGPGDDVYNGTPNGDVANGNGGNDQLNGNGGDDQLSGGDGNDILNGGDGIDTINGDAGNDFVNDIFDGAFDTVNGGSGEDGISIDFSAAPGNVTWDLTGSQGGGSGAFGSYSGFEYFGTISTGIGDDTIVTRNISRNETLNLGANNDSATVAGGNDVVNGGSGSDHLIINWSTATATILGNAPTANVGIGGFDGSYGDQAALGVAFTSIERFTITTGSGNDIIALPAAAGNLLRLGGGTDIGAGGSGNDTIHGEDGTDILAGGDGADIIFGGNDNDLMAGGAASDILIGGAGNDRMNGGSGANTLQGGVGDDTYVIENPGDSIYETLLDGTDTVETALAVYVLNAAFVENLTGTLNTGQSLVGNAEGNRIDGGTGNDEMQGLGGNDTYVVRNAGDTIVEQAGGGSDTIETGLASYALTVANIENLTGSSSSGQSLVGDAGANRIDGGTGNDELQGLGGNDTYVVRNAGDTIVEQAGGGTDTIETSLAYYMLSSANVENLTLTGSGASYGSGNGGDNVITGGTGNNMLRGGLGLDTLNGGAGNDDYLFDTAVSAGNVDTIQGFVSTQDRILLDGTIFTAISKGVLAPGAFATGTAAGDANDRIIYDTATGNLFYDADGSGGASSAMLFATLQGQPAITASDIYVI